MDAGQSVAITLSREEWRRVIWAIDGRGAGDREAILAMLRRKLKEDDQ